MATEDCTPDLLATLAQEIARKVGCHALRWWQDKYNPRRLYIEVSYTLSTGQPFPVWISTLIPGHFQDSRHSEPHGEPRADAPSPMVTKTPRERSDFLTSGTQPAPTPQQRSRS